MNDEPILRQIVRVVSSGTMRYPDARVTIGSDPPWNLYPADIIGRGVMRAYLSNQNRILGTQRSHSAGTCCKLHNVTLEPGKQNRERGTHNLCRRMLDHESDYLGVTDYQIGVTFEIREGMNIITLFHHDHRCIVIERIANGLHLWKDQASLRCT